MNVIGMELLKNLILLEIKNISIYDESLIDSNDMIFFYAFQKNQIGQKKCHAINQWVKESFNY